MSYGLFIAALSEQFYCEMFDLAYDQNSDVANEKVVFGFGYI